MCLLVRPSRGDEPGVLRYQAAFTPWFGNEPGAPRIHGELLKLGIKIAQSLVAKYMEHRRGPPSPGRKTFLLNHAQTLQAVDLFVVPTIGFRLLYGLAILNLER